MASRFTDTTIWKNQKWFKSLSVDHKLAFFYIKDNCDHSGVWQIDCMDLMEYTGIQNFNISKFVDDVNSDYDKFTGEKIEKTRLIIFQKKYLWIVKYLHFQSKMKDFTINPYVPAVYSALEIWEGFGILQEGLDKGYVTLSQPYYKGMLRDSKGSTTTKDKDKDNKDIKEGVETIKRKKNTLNGSVTVIQPLTNGKEEISSASELFNKLKSEHPTQ